MRTSKLALTDRQRETLAFLLITLIGALVLFLRNPDPIFTPVLYTEDANWSSHILLGDRLAAYLYARPDYLVVGQIALLDLAVQLSRLTANGTMAHLPQMVAVIAYMFWGFTAAIAFVSLRPWLSILWRSVVVALVLLLPLGSYMNEVIGRISNLGFLLLPLSFFIALLREAATTRQRSILLAFVLVLLILTNPICAVVASAALCLRVVRRILTKEKLDWIGDVVVFATIGICVIVLFERSGQGLTYSEDTFYWDRLIELAIARSFLFPYIFSIYNYITDYWALSAATILVILIVVAISLSDNRHRLFGFSIILASFGSIFITTIMRPMLSHHLHGYSATFPDRYYISQNIFAIILFSWTLSRMPRAAQIGGLTIIGLLVGLGIFRLFEYPEPVMRMDGSGTFADQVKSAVDRHPHVEGSEVIRIDVYPDGWWMMMPADLARATADASEQWRIADRPRRVDIGSLSKFPANQTVEVAKSSGKLPESSRLLMAGSNDIDLSQPGVLSPTGPDPFVTYAVPESNSQSHNDNVLAFDLSCENPIQFVSMQAFWSTSARPSMEENFSVLFLASSGRNLLPMDAHPTYYTGGRPTFIRLDFNNAQACGDISLKNVALQSKS